MAKIRDGRTYLGVHLTANDYYCENEIKQGEWIGKAAVTLEIAGQSIGKGNEAFELLRKNLHPQKKSRLTQRNAENRIAFYDFQCSAPKSVSIMAVMLEDDRLVQAHRQSVSIAFEELEGFAAKRCGHKNEIEIEITGNVVAARFEHDASRALDPQLHTHLVMPNATFSQKNGKWYGLETHEMLKAIRYCGKVYTNALAAKVQEIGYHIRAKTDRHGETVGFELQCVTEEEIRLYSKRRKDVEEGISEFYEKYGRMPNPEETHDISTKTRSQKLEEITTPEVRALQKSQVPKPRIEELQELKLGIKTIGLEDKTKESLNYAVEHIFERNSVAKEHEIMAEALNANLGGVSLEILKKLVTPKGFLATAFSKEGNPLLNARTTKENLHNEKAIVDMINGSLNDHLPIRQEIRAPLPSLNLNEDQNKAYEGVLDSKAKVTIIRGGAGTGKTHTLKAIDQAIKATGSEIFYMAPTTSATAELREAGLENATTLSDFVARARKFEISSIRRAFLVLDEAGLASTKQMYDLADISNTFKNRILLIGDTRQHHAVEAGDALAIIERMTRAPRFEINKVVRQKNETYKEASELMSKGSIEKALNLLNELGWVHECKDYLEKASKHYVDLRQNSKNVLIVAPTWAEIDQIDVSVRSHLKQSRVLDPKDHSIETFHSYKWTNAQKASAKKYQPGMAIQFKQSIGDHFKEGEIYKVAAITTGKKAQITITSTVSPDKAITTQPALIGPKVDVGEVKIREFAIGDHILLQKNDKKLGIKNNDRLIVSEIKMDGSICATNLQGKAITIPSSYKNLRYAYAFTSHKSQGLSVDEVIVAARNFDAFGKYVSISRGKEKATVYVPNKEYFISDKKSNTIKHRPFAWSGRIKLAQKLAMMLRLTGKRFGIGLKQHQVHKNYQAPKQGSNKRVLS